MPLSITQSETMQPAHALPSDSSAAPAMGRSSQPIRFSRMTGMRDYAMASPAQAVSASLIAAAQP